MSLTRFVVYCVSKTMDVPPDAVPLPATRNAVFAKDGTLYVQTFRGEVIECDDTAKVREILCKHIFRFNDQGYAVCNGSNGCTIRLHRLIMDEPTVVVDGQRRVVDHINGNRADNHMANLRLVSSRINALNRRMLSIANRSGCNGVSCTRDGNYQANWTDGGRKYSRNFVCRRYASSTDALNAAEAFLEAKRRAIADYVEALGLHNTSQSIQL